MPAGDRTCFYFLLKKLCEDATPPANRSQRTRDQTLTCLRELRHERSKVIPSEIASRRRARLVRCFVMLHRHWPTLLEPKRLQLLAMGEAICVPKSLVQVLFPSQPAKLDPNESMTILSKDRPKLRFKSRLALRIRNQTSKSDPKTSSHLYIKPVLQILYEANLGDRVKI